MNAQQTVLSILFVTNILFFLASTLAIRLDNKEDRLNRDKKYEINMAKWIFYGAAVVLNFGLILYIGYLYLYGKK